MPTPRPYEPDRKPAPRQWEGDLQQVPYCGGVIVHAVYPDGEPVPSGNILLLTKSGIVRCRHASDSLGLPLDSAGRIVDITPGSGDERIRELESEVAALRAQLAEANNSAKMDGAMADECIGALAHAGHRNPFMLDSINGLIAERDAARAQLAAQPPGPVLTLGPVEQELPFGIPHLWWNPDVKKWAFSTTGVGYIPCRRILGLDKVPPPEVTP